MRTLLHFQFPIDPFSAAVRDGTASDKLRAFSTPSSAEVQFRIAMTPEDLGRAGLDKLVKDWA